MTFANVCENQEQLSLLNRLLITAFPGCTIHQSRNPMRTVHFLSTQKVDAIFADADTCSGMMHKFCGDTAVYLLCRQEYSGHRAEGIQGCITYPLTEQKIQRLLQAVPQEFREVI